MPDEPAELVLEKASSSLLPLPSSLPPPPPKMYFLLSSTSVCSSASSLLPWSLFSLASCFPLPLLLSPMLQPSSPSDRAESRLLPERADSPRPALEEFSSLPDCDGALCGLLLTPPLLPSVLVPLLLFGRCSLASDSPSVSVAWLLLRVLDDEAASSASDSSCCDCREELGRELRLLLLFPSEPESCRESSSPRLLALLPVDSSPLVPSSTCLSLLSSSDSPSSAPFPPLLLLVLLFVSVPLELLLREDAREDPDDDI